MQKSVMYKTLIQGGELSLALLDTTAVVGEAIARHKLSPVAAAALGRTLTASAYLCSWLKNKTDGLSVTVNGGGVGGKIFVSGDAELHMRGFLENPSVELPPRTDGKLDVGGCVGRNGTLTVIYERGEGLPFVGTSELVSGEIAEDFSAYFLQSEQRPTAIALGVLVSPEGKAKSAGGLFLQPLPGASEETICFAEREIQEFSKLSSRLLNEGAEGILAYFKAVSVERREISYHCHCSREKIGRLVISLGKEEADRLLKEQGNISVHCHYCNTDYIFGREETEALFSDKDHR